MIAQDTV